MNYDIYFFFFYLLHHSLKTNYFLIIIVVLNNTKCHHYQQKLVPTNVNNNTVNSGNNIGNILMWFLYFKLFIIYFWSFYVEFIQLDCLIYDASTIIAILELIIIFVKHNIIGPTELMVGTVKRIKTLLLQDHGTVCQTWGYKQDMSSVPFLRAHLNI